MEKIAKTLEVFDEYEKRFAQARLNKPLRKPWLEKDRQEILEIVKDVLKFDEGMIPQIKVLNTQTQTFEGIEVRHMLFESWDQFYGINSLFVPEGGGKKPLVIICPGHAKTGRFGVGYQRMALTLARQGAYALILENIGQGSREAFGHWLVPEVFYCQKNLQGLILAESCAWIRYMAQQPFVDASRIGACGNSGGGTLTTFLCALAPELAAIASCGYPNEFTYVLQKEKKHCDCNLLHHVANRLEMWEVHSLFAPKPLLLETGTFDNLLPVDMFRKNSRKVQTVYNMMEAGEKFRSVPAKTKHSWETEDIEHIGGFFAETFDLCPPVAAPEEPLLAHEEVTLSFPGDAITTGQMVQALTGITAPEGLTLPDIIKPQYQGEDLDPESVVKFNGKSEIMRIFAQFELSL